jgi:hypothetical protein
MVNPPLITLRTDAGAVINSIVFPQTMDGNTSSPEFMCRIYNNYSGTPSRKDADNVQVTTYDSGAGGETKDIVKDRWAQVKEFDYNGGAIVDSYEAVGGASHKKSLVANGTGTIEGSDNVPGSYSRIGLVVSVPASTGVGLREMFTFVEYTYA